MKNLRLFQLVAASFIVIVGFMPSTSTSHQSGKFGVAGKSSIPTALQYLVTLKITMADGTWIVATQHEGKSIRIEKDGSRITIIPLSYDQSFTICKVQVLCETIMRNAQDSKVVDTFEISTGSIKLVKTRPNFSVKLETIKAISSAIVNNENSSAASLSARFECCINCGNVTACGCAVTMSCGGCCSGLCCDGGGGN